MSLSEQPPTLFDVVVVMIIIGLIAVMALLNVGCTSLVGPSKQYTCFTQPREYVSPGGQRTSEIDSYTQDTPCPKTPIK